MVTTLVRARTASERVWESLSEVMRERSRARLRTRPDTHVVAVSRGTYQALAAEQRPAGSWPPPPPTLGPWIVIPWQAVSDGRVVFRSHAQATDLLERT